MMAATLATRAVARLGASTLSAGRCVNLGRRTMSTLPPHMVREERTLHTPANPNIIILHVANRNRRRDSRRSEKKKYLGCGEKDAVNTRITDESGSVLFQTSAGTAHARALPHHDAGRHREVESVGGWRGERRRLHGEARTVLDVFFKLFLAPFILFFFSPPATTCVQPEVKAKNFSDEDAFDFRYSYNPKNESS